MLYHEGCHAKRTAEITVLELKAPSKEKELIDDCFGIVDRDRRPIYALQSAIVTERRGQEHVGPEGTNTGKLRRKLRVVSLNVLGLSIENLRKVNFVRVDDLFDRITRITFQP